METLQKKFDDDSNYYLSQKIPNSISSKELYCERDLGVMITFNNINLFIDNNLRNSIRQRSFTSR